MLLRVGDTVVLNSGSPPMTVKASQVDHATVTWYADGKVNEATLPLTAIKLYFGSSQWWGEFRSLQQRVDADIAKASGQPYTAPARADAYVRLTFLDEGRVKVEVSTTHDRKEVMCEGSYTVSGDVVTFWWRGGGVPFQNLKYDNGSLNHFIHLSPDIHGLLVLKRI